MKRSAKVGSLALIAGVLFLGLGCQARGIGDPCVPESIPSGGFRASEIYLETSSVQCRTRTCLVFRLDGDPSDECTPRTCPVPSDDCIPRTCADPTARVTAPNSAERVFCSCRCDSADGDANTPLCECTDGFHCVTVLTAGAASVRGGYCVPNELCTEDRDCPGASCNLTTGVCNL